MNSAIDSRVGMLNRAGKIVFYTMIGGIYREGSTPAEALGQRAPKAKTLKTYRVTVRAAHPAWNDKPFTVEVVAYSKAEANETARRKTEDATYGARYFFKAEEI